MSSFRTHQSKQMLEEDSLSRNETKIISMKDIVGNRIIEGEDRTKAGASVKAKGLFLTEIGYPDKILIHRNVRTKR